MQETTFDPFLLVYVMAVFVGLVVNLTGLYMSRKSKK